MKNLIDSNHGIYREHGATIVNRPFLTHSVISPASIDATRKVQSPISGSYGRAQANRQTKTAKIEAA